MDIRTTKPIAVVNGYAIRTVYTRWGRRFTAEGMVKMLRTYDSAVAHAKALPPAGVRLADTKGEMR